ncbi:aminotransferase class V-fold PLP-dependent enzyme [Frigoribacterium sp. PhB24]|uniref:aminotransferase class V-fold PLP-dependent enzyme n=1 Tax=Frigoribacterium sp. PhB24 TaxID=2485204 RepID=UPI000F47C9FF|nr:aminotransferase class V-fold PLP-dependent enzyme [Frigoribacterium sp. PhB24]ROS54537.1 selenocysteine lyase/cysteine desulfurase [Frigoribacterium sp. PhB24]
MTTPRTDLFVPVPGYLAACTMGLPLRSTLDAMRTDLDRWESGRAGPVTYGAVVEEARAAFARLARVDVGRVAIASQTSSMVAVIAASVPDGAEVLVPTGDFSSIVYPFVVQEARGVRVRSVPLDEVAGSVGPDTHLVAWSAVQSATGEVADDADIVAAAARHGALTLCDLTQAAGVRPVDASRYDASVTHAYKWLCCPRGVAFLTLGDRLRRHMVPSQAGWYAGADVWASCYGPEMNLATDARAFDVSPAWQAWAGALPALETFAGLDADETWAHATGTGDALCSRLGLEAQGRAIVTWADPDGRDQRLLGDAGLTVSGRAGRVRVAFHLWNDESDVEAVVAALGR